MRANHLAAACVMLAGAICACEESLSRTDALALAEGEIAAYARKEGLPREVFGDAAISHETGRPWVFDYATASLPRHLVRIYVASAHDIELHRLIE